MSENSIGSETINSSEGIAPDQLKPSKSGFVSLGIGAVFFGSMIVLVLQASTLVLTNEAGILEIDGMRSMINSYMITAAPWSLIGVAFGVFGFRQPDRSRVFAGWGLVLNFINLNGALLCLVILSIGEGL